METTTAEPKTMMVEPQKEHHWLQKFVGDWTFEGEVMMEPGKPPEKFNGTESVRAIGDLWVMGEGLNEMSGCGTATSIMMVGYDTNKKRFVGSFIMSVMTNMWVYEGELDSNEKVLTLNTEGPSMGAEGNMARFRDVTEFVSDDHRVLTSWMLNDDGTWQEVMRSNYYRRR